MIYRVGFNRVIKEDIFGGKFFCPKCNQNANFHLHRFKEVGSVFGIPVASRTMAHLKNCDSCHTYYEISKETYKSIKKNQIIEFNNGSFPEDIILQDFNPKKLKFGRKICSLILISLYSFIMIIGGIGMTIDIVNMGEVDASVPIGLVCFLLDGFIPLILYINKFKINISAKQ